MTEAERRKAAFNFSSLRGGVAQVHVDTLDNEVLSAFPVDGALLPLVDGGRSPRFRFDRGPSRSAGWSRESTRFNESNGRLATLPSFSLFSSSWLGVALSSRLRSGDALLSSRVCPGESVGGGGAPASSGVCAPV
eukprot:CAMPEP_0175923922 /NCGR_PEP_ID=MMETSP0108-20121206/14824_1 /TAXON_ID=195067 ORGANISM="Goniomonas pacifica, Strain CCMP1869" /NCGR_SAMPLE_ID=MMETSP0108 /ASSEMBLY_ACC=CAM_ASM_000204 /LENGTH=134 /DNA_ID=CAMNT_0017246945 /DNA_START=413 /DNA_END=818 /DNA_ORIENTATION=+